MRLRRLSKFSAEYKERKPYLDLEGWTLVIGGAVMLILAVLFFLSRF